jgi:hypothetical protein
LKFRRRNAPWRWSTLELHLKLIGLFSYPSIFSRLPKGWYASNLGKRYILREICAILAWMTGFGFKDRNFGDFTGVKGYPRPFFDWVAMAAA